MGDLYPQSFWWEKSNADRGTSWLTVKTFTLPPVKEKARHHSASASHPAQLHHHFLCSFLLFSHKDMALFPEHVTEKGLLSSPSADHCSGINQRSQSKKTLRGSRVTGTFSHQYEELRQRLECGPQQLPRGIHLQHLPWLSFGQDIKPSLCRSYSLRLGVIFWCVVDPQGRNPSDHFWRGGLPETGVTYWSLYQRVCLCVKFSYDYLFKSVKALCFLHSLLL